MKFLHRFLIEFGVLLLILSTWGCASRPDEDLKAAQAALDEAKAQQSEEFAQADWKSAMEAWDAAQAALAKSSYGDAKAQLMKAKGRFDKAGAIAKAKRDTILQEVVALQTTLTNRYNSYKGTLERVSLTGSAKKDIDQITANLDASLGKLNSEINAGQATEARATGQEALKVLNDLEKKLRP